MNGRAPTRWVLTGSIVLLVAALVWFFALPKGGPASPLRVFYGNAGGAVLFQHAQHAQRMDCSHCHHEMAAGAAGSCLACHHDGSFELAEWEDPDLALVHAETIAGGDAAACLGCHEHSALTDPIRPASQSSCANCHDADLAALADGHTCSGCHAVEEDAEAHACRQCHGNEEGEARTCEDCHAGDGYEADMMEHEALTAIEGHTCGGCHAVSRDADAVHHRCTRCHLDLEQGAFFARSRADEATVCATCHMKQ